MLKGLYTAAAGMRARLEMQDVTANNLANANTAGFQREVAAVISQRGRPTVQPLADRVGAGKTVEELHTVSTMDTRQGILEPTNIFSDLALEGKGYLLARTPAGLRPTRPSSLKVNARGELTTPDGHPLLDRGNSPIRVGSEQYVIGKDGTVRNSAGVVGQLRVVVPTGGVKREGANLLQAAGLRDAPAGSYELHQGYREHSNVNPVNEMVDMLTGMRAYEASQKAVVAQDQSIEQLLTVLRK